MGLRGTVVGVAVLAGVIIASGGSTASAMPANDVSANVAKMFVPDPDLTGVRRKAERVNGTAIDPEFLTVGPFDDDGDPPLVQPIPQGGLQPFSNCPDRASILGAPTSTDWYAQRTVWYEITTDTGGGPFTQQTLVTIDTGGSTFAAALEVFSGSGVPATFNQAAPVLPTNVVACDRNPNTVVPAVVSFLAQRGQRYFLMAGVAPLPSSPSSGQLRLSMRILDVDAPVVSIALEQTPDVGTVFEYTVSSNDPSATLTLPDNAVTQKREGLARRALTSVALGSKCDVAHMKNRARIGHYCVRGSSVLVRWVGVTRKKESGRVLASFTDRAGNVGSNSLQTQLRDRLSPKLGNTTARWTRRGRLFVESTCFGGPGTITVQVGAAKKTVKKVAFGVTTMRLHRAFPKVRRRTTFIHVICKDRSDNADDTWLFLPR